MKTYMMHMGSCPCNLAWDVGAPCACTGAWPKKCCLGCHRPVARCVCDKAADTPSPYDAGYDNRKKMR